MTNEKEAWRRSDGLHKARAERAEAEVERLRDLTRMMDGNYIALVAKLQRAEAVIAASREYHDDIEKWNVLDKALTAYDSKFGNG